MTDPISVSAALQAAGVIVSNIAQAKERLDRLKDILKSCTQLRQTLSDLESQLNNVERVYKKALQMLGAKSQSMTLFNNALENCRRPCDDVNEILLLILETRTTALKRIKAGSLENKLNIHRRDLESAKSSLIQLTITIR